jgi:Helix-turn-helix of insertion element transposase
MKASHKTAQNVTEPPFQPKPLSIEQKNAIDMLVTGTTDAEVASAIGCQRETVWRWRNLTPAFMSELEKGRQQYMSVAVDKLRSTLPKAVENVVAAINSGDLKASLALLKVVGFDNGAHFQPGETDPATIGLTICLQQLAKEGVKEGGMDSLLIDLDKNPGYEQRKREIIEELESAGNP